ncbi:glycosyltransferase family 4 protein [Chryseobacterium scophthalmum]|uniref:Glycosyltransferase involved in cell wall bisynthesis n=1 Tax=Chryseobacterium scophthalmum TaxID=59733 RepID=A0A1N6IZ60_9FLAO|nr:glycosyltransferase family 1 protein [Chryseobacterium scophthalmum]SIO37267.1 Glycosyltransferase involved in cell wall bisynthesis [Chryseobacterium scophthalmum]
MKKNILIDVERLKYPRSGIANVCISLIRGLDEKLCHFNYTLYGPEKNIPATQSDFKVINWKFWQKKIKINTSPFSLIHVTHQLSDYFHSKKSNQKKVVTLHDLNFLHDKSSARKIEKSKKLVQKNIGNADAIVCISEFVKDDFLKNKHFFTLKNDVKVDVIYNGLTFPENETFSSEKKYEFIGRKFILNIGVLFPKKNQEVLLNLITGNERELVLITSSTKSEYKEKFLEKVKKLGLEKKVHILENVENNEKYFLLQNCESYCHPSLAEGFGIPPVEAMHFGKPVFLSNLTSLPEIGGDLAFYFNDFSSDSMKKIYDEGIEKFNAAQENYIVKLKERASKFSYKIMAESYEGLYKRLLD